MMSGRGRVSGCFKIRRAAVDVSKINGNRGLGLVRPGLPTLDPNSNQRNGTTHAHPRANAELVALAMEESSPNPSCQGRVFAPASEGLGCYSNPLSRVRGVPW